MKQFNSKFNIGQAVADGIYQDLSEAFTRTEKGSFDIAFNKFRSIKTKIPSEKIRKKSSRLFKALEVLYFESHVQKNNKKKFKIIMRYSEVLINELDHNNMYLPSLKDMSTFA